VNYYGNKNNDAIKQWEKEIEADPNFLKIISTSKVLFYTMEKVWSILYGGF
jgi:hypothetical protein